MHNVTRPFHHWTQLVLALGLSGLCSLSASAQITPGQVGDTLKKAPELQQPQAIEPPSPAKPKPAPQGSGSGKTVTITAFEFSGNTLYSQEQLSDLIKEFLNKPITLLDIYAAADAVAEFYVDQGYTLASVNPPPQKISGGVAKLEVSEGRIGQVVVEGNQKYKTSHIRKYLAEVKFDGVYKSTDLETGMARLSELPGLTPRAVVRPGELYGTTDLVITATEKPVGGVMSVDNHGRDNIGEVRYSTTLTVNNPSGVEDQLVLLALVSEGGLLNYQYAAYSLPLSFGGGRLAMNYGHASFEVPGTTPVEGSSHNGKLALELPLARNRSNRSDVSLGVSRTRSNANVSGFTLNGTSITLMELGATYNHVYSNFAVTQLNASLSTNFDRFTAGERLASSTASTVASPGQRLRLELDSQHSQPLINGISALARFNLVYSPDPLSDVSQFSLGGPQSVRGYLPSEVRGDRGFLASLTLSRGFNLGLMRMTGRVFLDSGKVVCVDANASCPTDEPASSSFVETEQTLTSVGIGADAQYDRLTFKFDWATQRDEHRSSDGEDQRFWGSLFVSF